MENISPGILGSGHLFAPALAVAARYAVLLVLLGVALAARVIVFRRAERISLGDGGQSELTKRIRAHGNFSEYAPIIIALLALCALLGASPLTIHLLAFPALLGRVMHAIAVSRGNTMLRWRVGGMILTISAMVFAALTLLVLSFR